jgi:hypothetical protein
MMSVTLFIYQDIFSLGFDHRSGQRLAGMMIKAIKSSQVA